jgi:hypothetical protein
MNELIDELQRQHDNLRRRTNVIWYIVGLATGIAIQLILNLFTILLLS